MTSTTNPGIPETMNGERIEELQQIAGDHMFMHAVQTNDWRGKLKIYVKGDGVWVEDVHGNRHLDAMAGLWYKSAGYGRTEIADAVYAQMTAIDSPPAGSSTVPQIELAGKVAELYPDHGARSFFVSGGSEAVETAVKMAKKYSQLSGKGGAFKVISRRYSYHGGTAMSVSLGRNPAADPMGPEMPGALHVTNWNSYRLPFAGDPVDVAIKCANEIEEVIKHQGPETVAAIIAEPVSAAFGVQIPPAEYWQRLREIADQYDVVLIADEVITGFGRLGKWFGPTNWGVQPDITAVAKAITSGYAPLGAAIATKKIADAFVGGPNETFKHLITFGGHPIASAAALANLKIFEREDLVGNSRKMGTYLYEQLKGLFRHKIIGDVRGGLGLLAAVELVADRENKTPFPAEAGLAKKLPALLIDRKIVSFRAGDLISICPPLSISADEIDFVVDAIDGALGELESELGI
ncbi:MAG: aspartate aminotransferase family protein [Dehalococcoidia bacterium]|jgi:adenosylmethionine-8-amino-7-oxononanoate aminotransferase|nr:aspartate aminotransferase family protein [Dehalococcoidia bacterium]